MSTLTESHKCLACPQEIFNDLTFCSVACENNHVLTTKPSDLQVSGSHYKDMAIQPAEYATKNKLGFLEGNAIKYISRHGKKNGVDDLRKAIHCIELLIEYAYDSE